MSPIPKSKKAVTFKSRQKSKKKNRLFRHINLRNLSNDSIPDELGLEYLSAKRSFHNNRGPRSSKSNRPWRILPKDSCEVYRARRKKKEKLARRKKESDSDMNSASVETDTSENSSCKGKKQRGSRRRNTRTSSQVSSSTDSSGF